MDKELKNGILLALHEGSPFNVIAPMVGKLKGTASERDQGDILVKAVTHSRKVLLKTMVKDFGFCVDACSSLDGTALAVSVRLKKRDVSKVLVEDLKADIHKTWRVNGSTHSVLAGLIGRKETDELVFFLDEFKVDVNVPFYRDERCKLKTSLLALAIEKDWMR